MYIKNREKIFGSKREKVDEGYRKLQIGELHYL
jgi:hypothetical protein